MDTAGDKVDVPWGYNPDSISGKVPSPAKSLMNGEQLHSCCTMPKSQQPLR